MDLLRGVGDRLVVVDVETSGVFNSDRVVEVAAVTVSPHFRTVDEWDTLVNPERDVGPSHIHGITVDMVSAAPTFAEVAAALAERLQGAVIVAHNVAFDVRMLVNEYTRAGGHLDPGTGLCTLLMTSENLARACARRSIPTTAPHRALADARATARLLRSVATEPDQLDGLSPSPASVDIPQASFRPRTMRRDLSSEQPDDAMPYLARLADRAHHFGAHDNALVYMDLLDWVISDLEVTNAEWAQLEELAIDVGLSPDEVTETHEQYIVELMEAALRDGHVSEREYRLIAKAAKELRVKETTLVELMTSVADRLV